MGTFTKINNAEVISSEGFSIRFSHIKLTYKEGKKALSVDIEHLIEKMVIYSKSIKYWHPPFESDPIDQKRIEHIKARIGAALAFLCISYEIVEEGQCKE